MHNKTIIKPNMRRNHDSWEADKWEKNNKRIVPCSGEQKDSAAALDTLLLLLLYSRCCYRGARRGQWSMSCRVWLDPLPARDHSFLFTVVFNTIFRSPKRPLETSRHVSDCGGCRCRCHLRLDLGEDDTIIIISLILS